MMMVIDFIFIFITQFFTIFILFYIKMRKKNDDEKNEKIN